MLATFAFDVCHDVYRAAREAIDEKIPTLNMEAAGKYQWHPDRMPRLAEFVCDFARAGERALGGDFSRGVARGGRVSGKSFGGGMEVKRKQAEAYSTSTIRRASLLVMFRVYYLGGAEYQSARRHMGISEITWGDWSEEIRGAVGGELMRAAVFPPARYFRETTARAKAS
ncbi:MAG TPA: hypothetical protein VK709_16095 [Candidatus Saccharimonadales bacterium]|jgi:hypothetical protein|nr:hypothetical protein [Candidatus Saccharimonadales bacterium]